MFSWIMLLLISVNIHTDKKSVEVGQEFSVTFTAFHPNGYQIDPKEVRKGLLEYYGFGLPPFHLVHEEVLKDIPNRTEIRYTLGASVEGDFDLSFGVVKFLGEGGMEKALSPVIPIHVTLGAVDKDYMPPPPPFLLLKPLLPVEIDMELRQKLMNESEIPLWKQIFFLRRLPLYILPFVLVFVVVLIISYAIFGTAKLNVERQIDVNATLKDLLRTMRVIYEKQKRGEITPEKALVEMQSAMLSCFELKLLLPASHMTVEELRGVLMPRIRNFQELDAVLEMTLGIKFGKKSVGKDKSIAMMEKAIEGMEGLVQRN